MLVYTKKEFDRMRLKELLRQNRENIESITVNSEVITFFSNDVKVLDLIEQGNGLYHIILNEIIIKLDEIQVEQESYFNKDKVYYYDLVDCKIDLKLR